MELTESVIEQLEEAIEGIQVFNKKTEVVNQCASAVDDAVQALHAAEDDADRQRAKVTSSIESAFKSCGRELEKLPLQERMRSPHRYQWDTCKEEIIRTARSL